MWDAFLAWFQSPAGQRVLDAAVIPALAILVAGLVAALIGRGAVRSVIARTDRYAVAGTVAAVVEAARVLGSAPQGAERERIERLRTEADVRLRLSGLPGASTAAEWASLRLDAIERDAASPVPQTRAAVDEVRDRLLAWLARPRRSKRLFGSDVERLEAERTARDANRRAPEAAPTSQEPAAPARRADAGSERDRKQEPGAAEPPAQADTERSDDARPEPVPARAQNLAHEVQAERARSAAGSVDAAVPPAAAAAEAAPSPTTEPVLIQRTRLDSMERQPVDHARHARPSEPAPAVAVVALEPTPQAAAPEPEPAPAPEPEPSPVGERQPTPAWLDTYDDEAEVTRDIDLSRTPPPKAASAVRDRTHTGDDIVPRH